MDPSRLIELAKEASSRARAHISGFRVGAALLCANGKIYTGANIENDTLGLTLCAERVALAKALSEEPPERTTEDFFVAIAVYAEDREGKPRVAPPCGACRQLLYEYAPGLVVILGDGSQIPLRELFPRGFRLPKDLP